LHAETPGRTAAEVNAGSGGNGGGGGGDGLVLGSLASIKISPH